MIAAATSVAAGTRHSEHISDVRMAAEALCPTLLVMGPFEYVEYTMDKSA